MEDRKGFLTHGPSNQFRHSAFAEEFIHQVKFEDLVIRQRRMRGQLLACPVGKHYNFMLKETYPLSEEVYSRMYSIMIFKMLITV